MKNFLGPILSFRGIHNKKWCVSALYVTDTAQMVDLNYKSDAGPMSNCQPVKLYEHKGKIVWRYDMEIELISTKQKVTYSDPSGSSPYIYAVPTNREAPKIAYASCNGFSHMKEAKKVADKNALWKDIFEKNEKQPYNIFLMGGDQIYADSLWENVAEIKKWTQKKAPARFKDAFTDRMKSQIEDFYFNLYCERWSQPEMKEVFACIPTVMMWDDHDIFDGWGSYNDNEQNCPVYKGIFNAARKYFCLFQLQIAKAEPHPAFIDSNYEKNFSLGFRLGTLSIISLDMRSERTNEQVISPSSWEVIYEWLDNVQDSTSSTKHLYVMSSIPVVHPDFSAIEDLLGIFPGQREIEDDLRDHWHSRPHRGERVRLIHRLLSLSEKASMRITLLSGDVHVAALGVITTTKANTSQKNAQVINQLTSSGIVHPAPNAVVLLALKTLSLIKEEVDQGISAELINFPGTKHSFIGSRNWLSLEPDELENKKNRIWANWYVEHELDTPYTQVIHPINFDQYYPAESFKK